METRNVCANTGTQISAVVHTVIAIALVGSFQLQQQELNGQRVRFFS